MLDQCLSFVCPPLQLIPSAPYHLHQHQQTAPCSPVLQQHLHLITSSTLEQPNKKLKLRSRGLSVGSNFGVPSSYSLCPSRFPHLYLQLHSFRFSLISLLVMTPPTMPLTPRSDQRLLCRPNNRRIPFDRVTFFYTSFRQTSLSRSQTTTPTRPSPRPSSSTPLAILRLCFMVVEGGQTLKLHRVRRIIPLPLMSTPNSVVGSCP